MRVVEGVRLPPQPKIILAIQQELRKEDPSFPKIADLLSKDAALSAKVLKVVNSPLFSSGQEIDSISRALSRLGLMNFFTIVLMSSLKDALGNDPLANRLWEHSEIVAALCREIARKTRVVDPEYAYMAGLFHDAAMPILLKKFDHYEEVMEKVVSTGGDIQAYEVNRGSTHHAVVSYLLARSWGLPDEVIEAIQFHHTDNVQVFSDRSRTLGCVLMLADQLGRESAPWGTGTPEEADCWQGVYAQIQLELGIDEDDIKDFRESAAEIAQSI